MYRERYKELISNSELKLTEIEIKNGWIFCKHKGLINLNETDCDICLKMGDRKNVICSYKKSRKIYSRRYNS